MKKIRVLIADDHAVVRMGFVSLLESERDIAVSGEAGNGEEAVRLAVETQPDVVLMDLVMPKMDGAEATAAIRRANPATRVVLLTTFSTSDGISRALEAGADGALLKNADYAEVVEAIRAVAAGETHIAPEVQKMLKEDPPIPDLSDRQRDILEAMTRGLTNADVAKMLGITPDGVKFHITSLFAKLGVVNRAEAIALAIRKQIVKP